MKKKQQTHESPDLSKMQAVYINDRTTIYIPVGADAEEAKNRYLARFNNK
jgi:hypothetical protein